MHEDWRSGRGIEVESPKCEGFGLNGLLEARSLRLETESLMAMRFALATPHSKVLFFKLEIHPCTEA
jgi:hypothetical protein